MKKYANLMRIGVFALILGATLGSVVIGAEPAEKTPAAEPSQSAEPAAAKPEAKPVTVVESNACVTGPAALEDIKNQRAKLQAREQELAKKEKELKAIESALQDEFKKLEAVRGEVAKGDELRKKENEGKVAKIVETVESMSPKSASTLLASLDETLAVAAMQRMTTPKLAKIMNVMEPGRSSRLTELLAGVARSRGNSSASRDAVKATEAPETGGKGGENR